MELVTNSGVPSPVYVEIRQHNLTKAGGWEVFDALFPAAQKRDHEITSTLSDHERKIVLKFLKNAAQTLKDVDSRLNGTLYQSAAAYRRKRGLTMNGLSTVKTAHQEATA